MGARPVILVEEARREHCHKCDVRQKSVCRAIDDAGLAKLSAAAVIVDVKKGETFMMEGDPAIDFFNVTHGTVKLFKLMHDGRQQVVGFAGAGYLLGLAVSKAYASSAIAIEPVRMCRFSRTKLRTLMDDFPRLEALLLEIACDELAAAQEQMLLLGRKSAQERLASFLVSWGAITNPCAHGDRVALPMTRGEIADYLGLTIETVSRTFSKFKAEKRIQTLSNDEVILLDRAWLENLAEGAMASPSLA